MNQWMTGYAQPDRTSLRILQPFRHFSSCRQNERVRSRRHRLDQPVRPVFDPRINANFGQVTAHQSEVVFFVRTPNSVDALDRSFVADVASKCVTRVGGISNQATIPNNLHNLAYATRLGIGWMNVYQLGHARIVGTWQGDARPENPVLFRSFER